MSTVPSALNSAPPALAPAFNPGWNLLELQQHLGGIPPERIRAFPFPGTVTEVQFDDFVRGRELPCELVDGVIVEKAVGNFQSNATFWLQHYLALYLVQNDRGFVMTTDGLARVARNQIRSPDVSFVDWKHFPDRVVPNVLPVAPDLAVEILSSSNTTAEMDRKRRDLFAAGTRLMWIVEPELPTVAVYTSADGPPMLLRESDSLTGGEVLPGFELPIREWFARVVKRA